MTITKNMLTGGLPKPTAKSNKKQKHSKRRDRIDDFEGKTSLPPNADSLNDELLEKPKPDHVLSTQILEPESAYELSDEQYTPTTGATMLTREEELANNLIRDSNGTDQAYLVTRISAKLTQIDFSPTWPREQGTALLQDKLLADLKLKHLAIARPRDLLDSLSDAVNHILLVEPPWQTAKLLSKLLLDKLDKLEETYRSKTL